MRFNTNMFEHDIPRVLNWVWSQIGLKLEKRVKGFEHEQRRNPLLATYYRDTFPLEFALVDAWRQYHSREGAILPRGIDYDIAYGFAATAQRIYQALPSLAQKRLHGSLKDGATGVYGLRPLAYEMTMAGHLVNKGYDVNCVDLEGKGQFDFLAVKDGIEFEVECKTTSPDKGRKIHRKEFNRLSYGLLSITTKLVDAGGHHVIRLTVPDRLQTSEQRLAEFRGLVSSAVSEGTASGKIGRAEYKAVNVDHWPLLHEVSETIARDFLERLFGAEKRHVVWHYRPSHGFAVIGAESEKPDTVLDAIADEAKAAADQCTGNRPALIMMQLMEITPDELKMLLETSSGIHFVAHEVFKNDKRSYVDCMGFSLPARRDNFFETEITGTATVLHNPSPKMPPSDEIRGLFRAPQPAPSEQRK